MLDEVGIAMMGKVMPAVKYIEVVGMPINENNHFQLLASPIPAVAEQAVVEDEAKTD